MEQRHGDYLVSDDPARLDVAAIHTYLSRAYWSEKIPLEVVQRAVANSLCLGAYDSAGKQVGLARFISDYATFCYVCDVYVLEEHRGRGLANALMVMSTSHAKLQNLRRWNLVTRDAHPLYAQHGFGPAARPDRYMEKLDPGVYQR